jgi:hypothetical protein
MPPRLLSRDPLTGEETYAAQLGCGRTELVTGHDYVLTYRLGRQRDREARMGFLGYNTVTGALLWNARPFAGTVSLPEHAVSSARQVTGYRSGSRDDDRRYLDRKAEQPGNQ